MNKQESEVLNITRFVMSVFIVFFHAYTSVQMYSYWKELPVYKSITRVFSLQIGEMGVPVFFLISGYLFFMNYQPTWIGYKAKIQKRFFSLFIPYVFWNAFILCAYYSVEHIPVIFNLFNDSGKKMVHDFTICDFFFAFWSYKGGNPILTQMWFVRDLILLIICSPVVFFLVRYVKLMVIVPFGVIWFIKQEVPNWESALLFFSIGAYCSINGKNLIIEMLHRVKFLFILTLLLIFSDFIFIGTIISIYIHRFLIFFGVFFIVALIAWLVEKKKIRDVVFLTSGSFFLYVMHDPMIRFIRKYSLLYTDHSSELQMITIYFISVIIDIVIVYSIFWCLQKYFPGFLKWVTGGR